MNPQPLNQQRFSQSDLAASIEPALDSFLDIPGREGIPVSVSPPSLTPKSLLKCSSKASGHFEKLREAK